MLIFHIQSTITTVSYKNTTNQLSENIISGFSVTAYGNRIVNQVIGT